MTLKSRGKPEKKETSQINAEILIQILVENLAFVLGFCHKFVKVGATTSSGAALSISPSVQGERKAELHTHTHIRTQDACAVLFLFFVMTQAYGRFSQPTSMNLQTSRLGTIAYFCKVLVLDLGGQRLLFSTWHAGCVVHLFQVWGPGTARMTSLRMLAM